jgi:YVTN family beta-propeller protein
MDLGRRTRLLCLGGALLVGGCGTSDSASADSANKGASEPPSVIVGGVGGNASFVPGGPAPGSGGAMTLPPEKEFTVSFELPHAGEHYVYAANTDSDTVAVIDATKLTIQIVQAGDQPRFLQTLAGTDAAIVLNVGSNDATIIRTDSSGASRTSSALVKPGSNAIAVAPDGAHAVVYFDSAAKSGSSTPGSPQDVTVLSLSSGGDTYNDMSIGYHPSRVFFSSDSARAFIVTDDGVSILDFAAIDEKAAGVSQQGTEIARTVSLGHAKTDNALDVSVTPDGRYALSREEGKSELKLLDLDSGDIKKLDVSSIVPTETTDAGAPPDAGLAPDAGAGESDAGADGAPPPKVDGAAPAPSTTAPAPTATATAPATPPAPAAPPPVTDLDLAPSGKFALAVIRDRATMVQLPIPAAFDDPSSARAVSVKDEIIGSVTLTADESTALLYTTAIDPTLPKIPDELKRVTILNLDGAPEPRTVQLRKAISSVAVAPDSKTAVVVSVKLPGDPNDATIDDDTRADRQFGYSLVQIDSGFVKLQVTEAPLGPFALVPDGSHLLVLFNQAAIREVQNVELDSFRVTPIELGSPPTSVGTVASSERAFVGQDHPDGRISFIDYKTNGVQTVTGFELNSRIRQ